MKTYYLKNKKIEIFHSIKYCLPFMSTIKIGKVLPSNNKYKRLSA